MRQGGGDNYPRLVALLGAAAGFGKHCIGENLIFHGKKTECYCISFLNKDILDTDVNSCCKRLNVFGQRCKRFGGREVLLLFVHRKRNEIFSFLVNLFWDGCFWGLMVGYCP